jgi:hypothetical protein
MAAVFPATAPDPAAHLAQAVPGRGAAPAGPAAAAPGPAVNLAQVVVLERGAAQVGPAAAAAGMVRGTAAAVAAAAAVGPARAVAPVEAATTRGALQITITGGAATRSDGAERTNDHGVRRSA